MEQPTNGLNASTAYDLACRYNSLFQYNPSAAAAAACAAAYGMFNNTSVKTQSQTSPSLNTTSFQSINTIATSSIPSSSSSNIASSPTSSLSSLTSSSSNNLVQKNINNSATNEKDIKETKVEQDSKKEFDTVSENSSVSEHFDDDVHNSTCNENEEDQTGLNESENKNDNVSRTRLSSQSEIEQNDDMIENNISINNNNSKIDDEYEIEMSKIQQKLSSDAEKSINSCLNQTCNDLEENYVNEDEPQEDEEEGLISNNEDDESPKKRRCLLLDEANTTNNQNETINNSSTATTLTSMMLNIKNNIQKKRSSEEIDCNNISRNNNHNKNNFCLKLNQIDYLNLRKNLIQSVNQAIELTLESFYESKQSPNQNIAQLNNKQINGNLTQKNMTNLKKFNSNHQQQSVQPIQPPKRIRVNEKISKHASTNFNVSKILSKDNLNQKRKFMPLPTLPNPTSLTHHQIKTEPNNLLKTSIHHSASSQSLQNESLTSNLSAFQNKAQQSTSLLTTNQKSQQLSHFYSAAMSHLHQNTGQASNFNYSHLINPSSNQVPPQASFFNQNQHLSTQIPSSASSSSNGIISSSGSSSSSTTSISNPPGSISSLFAAHQHQILIAAAQAAANGQNPNYLQMAAAANRLFNPYILEQHQQQNSSQTQASSTTVNRPLIGQVQSSQSNFFHNSPHKRRRTKVTDTRLSPRNPALLRNNLIASSLIGMSLNKNRNGDESPLNEQDDDQDNFINQDYDEEQQQNNQDDDSASSGCNESGSTAGSTAGLNGQSMSNGFGNNNNNSYMNEMNGESQTSEYNGYQTSTLSSLHLRKAKLMFFFTRYPSSTILRNFFPDVKFNKANTAQLVKWFSNFREFFYIQMEKYARQHLAEGIRNAEEILVDCDSEIFRALNSHYNRNNQLEIPASFCYVIQATLREFFKAIQESKDLDPSWKKAIYKVIARMDDQIPEYFKSVQWMESLETNI